MKKYNAFVSMIFMLGVVLVACGGTSLSSSREMAMEAPAAEPAFYGDQSAIFVEEEAAMAYDTADAAANIAQQTSIPAERLIIRTGNLDVVVLDTQATLDEIEAMATAMGGWVVNSGVYSYGTADRGDITIRIPAEKFDEALDTIKTNAVDVNSESTSGQDVTEEYVDLSSRLGNLEATAERVRSFLDDANRVEDALAVNQELSRLEEQIEVIKGRMQYLSQSAAFSTITVSLIPDELNQPIEVAGWRPEGVARDAIEALIEALQGLATFGIWLVIFGLPVLLIIGLPLYFIGRWVVRRWRGRRRGRAAAEAPKQS